MKRFAIPGLVCLLVTAGGLLAQNDGPQPQKKSSQQQHAPHHPAPGDMHKQMQAMNKMMVQHLGESDTDYERRFIDMMIPHHEGAIMMARHALEHANRPELKEMAKKIIEEQEKEIAHLKHWRQEWYGNSAERQPGAKTE
jgi:uncharacterized protein (DUF305 family)